MQCIGMVGGMSWESSAVYYTDLNRGVEERVGGLASARTVMASVDFAALTDAQREEDWDTVATMLVDASQGVERAGADFLLLCTTTFHEVADRVQDAVGIPLLHLADVVAEAAKAQQLEAVGLIGTSFTMERDFFRDRIASHGLRVVVPEADRHAAIDRIIYEELVHGRVLDSSRREVVQVVDELWDSGAGGVILGCTELELLVRQADCDIPVLPCTTLHVGAALDRALA